MLGGFPGKISVFSRIVGSEKSLMSRGHHPERIPGHSGTNKLNVDACFTIKGRGGVAHTPQRKQESPADRHASGAGTILPRVVNFFFMGYLPRALK